MKHVHLYRMRLLFCLCFLLSALVGSSQVNIGEAVYQEDFGAVPSDWNSKGDKYRESGNMASYREEVGGRVDGCGYTFGERFKALFAWRNASLCEAPWWNAGYYGNGKYAVGISGDELGEGTFKSWHNVIDHTGNPNGMAFIANAKTEKGSLVIYKTVSDLAPGGVYRLRAYIGNGENGTGAAPEIKMMLENDKVNVYKSQTISASKDGVPWVEFDVFLDVPMDASSLKYSFYSMNNASLGNIFIIDDISLSPVYVRADAVNVDFCSEPGKVWFDAWVDGIPEGLAVYTRLMRKSKDGGVWEWDDQAGSVEGLRIYTTEDNYNRYDYRLVVSLTTSALSEVPDESFGLNEFGTFSVTGHFTPAHSCEAWGNFEIGTDFCTKPDSVFFKTAVEDFPVTSDIYFRLMRKKKGETDWEWAGDVVSDYQVAAVATDFITYDFRVATEVASSDFLTKSVTPSQLTESINHGCFMVKDVFRNDFCMQLYGVALDYIQVPDSVVVEPSLVVTLEGAMVYLRWLYRPFGTEEWHWWGEARPAEQNRIDWLTFMTGDFRAVYALNPDLLRQMPEEETGTRGYYYVATEKDAIKGIPLEVEVRKSFVGGGVRLEATTEKMPSAVTSAVKGCWVSREKGMEQWTKLEGFEQRFGVPDYIRHEYMFVASMSQAVLDTLNFNSLTRDNPAYWLSDTVKGEHITLKENIRDFCTEPGEVLLTADFSNEGIPADMPETGRWRQREKGSDVWTWINNFSGIKPLQVSMADYLAHDYQMIVAWSTDSLDAWANRGLPEEQLYYMLEDRFVNADYCLAVDTIRVVSTGRDLWELQPQLTREQPKLTVYGRWMRKIKGEEAWAWVGESSTQGYSLSISSGDFGRFDYRFCAALSAVVLEQEPVRIENRPFLAVGQIEGKTIHKPEIAVPGVSCIAHQDANEVVLTITAGEGIRALVYRLGESENVTLPLTDRQELRFVINRDSVFHLLSYEIEGICDSVIRNEEILLKYIPKLHITGFTDYFGCHHSEQVIKPLVTGGTQVEYQWTQGGNVVSEVTADSLKVVFGETGALPLNLKVSKEGWCPEDSTVFLITGEYPKIEYTPQTAPEELCVGQTFEIAYRYLEADQYRISLKSTNMPGFVFYPGNGSVKETEHGKLEIKNLQTLLTATDFMVGYEFTFQVQIFKTAEYRGISYQCEEQFDYRFKVRPTITSRYPSDMKLCGQELLSLEPVLELNGNEVSLYRWQLWDGVHMESRELKSSVTDQALEAEVQGEWNGKRLQLKALCECGEVVVQDINLSVYAKDSNWITGPEHTVLWGEKVGITGSEVKLKGLSYFWESRKGGEEWRSLPGENTASIEFYAPDTTMEYRRTLTGEGWNCPDMQAGPVKAVVFNNLSENKIYLKAEDSLVTAGTAITIHSDSKQREDVTYSWEEYKSGKWTEIAGETGKELTYTPEEISKFRRVAWVGGHVLYSNEVLVNVYDNSQNRILLASGVITPGQKVRVIGNYVNIPGVVYRWFADSGAGWRPVDGQNGCNLEMFPGGQTKLMRYVYLPGQEKDSLGSNELTVYVFDNENDNRISSESMYVCGGEEVTVTGKKVNGEGISYRWEYSLDAGNTWSVLNNEVHQNYIFKADKNIAVRRRILYTDAPEWYSNVLVFSIIRNSADNRIEQPEVMIAGTPGLVKGTPVTGAAYEWEISENGETDWQLLAGADGEDLVWEEGIKPGGGYVRRHILFAGEAGCEGYSNVLKLKIFDPTAGNTISGSGNFVCQWTGFTLTGSDLSELNARYQWYRNEYGAWQPLSLAIGKDLTVYEGCGKTTLFRRDALIGGLVNESNILEIQLWDDVKVANDLKQPGIVCAGQSVNIEGSDAFAGEIDLSEYIKAYSWEVSTTGAGGTWERVELAGNRDLFLDHAEHSRWYCRIIQTVCGTDLRSQPIRLDVREKLKFTLRNDAPFEATNPKNPIRISVDEDYFDAYEIKVDGKLVGQEPEYLFYGWMPRRDYQVIANVVSATGCSQTDTMRMRTPDVDLPNVLTPNNDGFNDVLLEGYDLRVYNRWGNLLYAGREGWDGRFKGTLVSAGTYFYVLKISHVNGEVTEYKKSVTVKRDKN